MFGYVTINPSELKMKDYQRYQSYYCGLCQSLKKQHGRRGQVLLNYDMTFLVILLSGLYEGKTSKGKKRCIVHPFKSHSMLVNEFTEYAADMNILMAYHHFIDDWKDKHSILKWCAAKMLNGRRKKIEDRYQRQGKAIRSCIQRLTKYEIQGETNLDLVSGCMGEMLAELFVYRNDIWESSLKRMGFYLGKFIYLMDAYDDLGEDRRSGNYNPFLKYSNKKNFQEYVESILNMMMAECSKSFERLPIIKNVDILRNILYSGVWVKHGIVKRRSSEIKNPRSTGKSDHNDRR